MAELRAEDRAAVDAALQEILEAPQPVDRSAIGCLIALPAFVILLVFPIVGRRFALPSEVATTVIVAGTVLLVVGLGIWFLAGGSVRGHTLAAAEAALRRLEAWEPGEDDREEALRAATLLIANHSGSYGATSFLGFDREEARRRIGTMMPLVEAVERHLVEKDPWFAVFTGGDDADDADAAEVGGGPAAPGS